MATVYAWELLEGKKIVLPRIMPPLRKEELDNEIALAKETLKELKEVTRIMAKVQKAKIPVVINWLSVADYITFAIDDGVIRMFVPEDHTLHVNESATPLQNINAITREVQRRYKQLRDAKKRFGRYTKRIKEETKEETTEEQ